MPLPVEIAEALQTPVFIPFGPAPTYALDFPLGSTYGSMIYSSADLFGSIPTTFQPGELPASVLPPAPALAPISGVLAFAGLGLQLQGGGVIDLEAREAAALAYESAMAHEAYLENLGNVLTIQDYARYTGGHEVVDLEPVTQVQPLAVQEPVTQVARATGLSVSEPVLDLSPFVQMAPTVITGPRILEGPAQEIGPAPDTPVAPAPGEVIRSGLGGGPGLNLPDLGGGDGAGAGGMAQAGVNIHIHINSHNRRRVYSL